MRLLFEYDLYFPLSGKGTAKSATEELERVKKELTRFFGGVTDFRHRGEGSWKMGGVTFHDEVILLRVLGDDRDRARQFMQGIAGELKQSLDQEEVLIVERDVVALGAS
jgi:hypothetical protein